MERFKHSVLLALSLALWIGVTGFAQTATLFQIPVIADLFMQEVPADPNAWVLRIVSGGGYTGQYRGLVIVSQGTFRCTMEIQCQKTLSAPELESFSTLFSEAILSKWPQPNASSSSSLSVCNDCIRFWMELRHREKDGVEKLYFITWDDVSKSTLPVELKQIYDTAVSFRR